MLQAQEQQFAGGPSSATVLIAIGSNLSSPVGPPQVNVQRAIDCLDSALGPVAGKSRLYRTPCFPSGSGPDYVNAAVRLTSTRPPSDLLKALHQIEADFRRERHERWGARTLDLDLLAVNDAVMPDTATQETWRQMPIDAQRRAVPETLILPHPRLQDRAFVLVPLADIAADWCHPLTGLTVTEMLATLPAADRDAVVAI